MTLVREQYFKPSDSKWYKLKIESDNETIKLFIDGVEIDPDVAEIIDIDYGKGL
jgi:hypothetical protein